MKENPTGSLSREQLKTTLVGEKSAYLFSGETPKIRRTKRQLVTSQEGKISKKKKTLADKVPEIDELMNKSKLEEKHTHSTHLSQSRSHFAHNWYTL